MTHSAKDRKFAISLQKYLHFGRQDVHVQIQYENNVSHTCIPSHILDTSKDNRSSDISDSPIHVNEVVYDALLTKPSYTGPIFDNN